MNVIMGALINTIITAPIIMQWQQAAHQGPHMLNYLPFNVIIGIFHM